ncbi:MAG TPA: hypothetical protein VN418_00410 [Gammaproteobacteria bacterium]|nr:hypothetical protein [Gammaproteobacteria bacterium]
MTSTSPTNVERFQRLFANDQQGEIITVFDQAILTKTKYGTLEIRQG